MVLRDVIEADLPVLFEQHRDPAALSMASLPERTREEFDYRWRTHVFGIEGVTSKAIEVDGQIAGHVVGWKHERRRLIGYWLGRAFWGRGLATAALKEILLHYETTRPLHAYVAVKNPGSVRVLEKCGFAPFERSVGADGVEQMLMKLS